MSETIILDFGFDPIQSLILGEQLSNRGWTQGELQQRRVAIPGNAEVAQIVATLAQELLPITASTIIFNLPESASLAAQVVVASSAILGMLPQCVQLLYPSGDNGRDTTRPYRLAGMLPLEVAEHIGAQAVEYVQPHKSSYWAINLGAEARTAAVAGEMHLPLGEHHSVAAQMMGYVPTLSVSQWREVLVVLPRSAQLAVLALSFIHGLTGRWPRVVSDAGAGGRRAVALQAVYEQAHAWVEGSAATAEQAIFSRA